MNSSPADIPTPDLKPMSLDGFFFHLSRARARGEHRVWFRNQATQVVCHYDLRKCHFVSFCGGILPPNAGADFFNEPWEFGYRDLLAVPCSESHTVAGRIAT